MLRIAFQLLSFDGFMSLESSIVILNTSITITVGLTNLKKNKKHFELVSSEVGVAFKFSLVC